MRVTHGRKREVEYTGAFLVDTLEVVLTPKKHETYILKYLDVM